MHLIKLTDTYLNLDTVTEIGIFAEHLDLYIAASDERIEVTGDEAAALRWYLSRHAPDIVAQHAAMHEVAAATPAGAGDTPLTFGKYSGLTVTQIGATDRGYVEWLAAKSTNDAVRHAAQRWLDAEAERGRAAHTAALDAEEAAVVAIIRRRRTPILLPTRSGRALIPEPTPDARAAMNAAYVDLLEQDIMLWSKEVMFMEELACIRCDRPFIATRLRCEAVTQFDDIVGDGARVTHCPDCGAVLDLRTTYNKQRYDAVTRQLIKRVAVTPQEEEDEDDAEEPPTTAQMAAWLQLQDLLEARKRRAA